MQQCPSSFAALATADNELYCGGQDSKLRNWKNYGSRMELSEAQVWSRELDIVTWATTQEANLNQEVLEFG